jgi:hypothetical protein
MGEFRQRDETLVIVVQIIHYCLCNYTYSNLPVKSGSITFPHGSCTLAKWLISGIILGQWLLKQQYAHHDWYTNRCLLVFSINKNLKYKI